MVTVNRIEDISREEITQPCLTKMTKMTNATTVVKLAISRETARQNHAPMPSPVEPGMTEIRTTKVTKIAPSNNHKSTW